MAIPHESAFWYHGRLTPAGDAARFELIEYQIDPDGMARLEVLRDGIAVWSRPHAPAARSIGQAARFIRVMLGAYAFYTGRVLSFEATGWVEATEAQFEGTLVGFTLGDEHDRPPTTSTEPPTSDLQRAADLTRKIEHTPWRRCVMDLRDAMRHARSIRLANLDDDSGDDCFIYAFRAIESARVAAAVEVPGANVERFRALVRLINADADEFDQRIDVLARARNAVAHGSDRDDVLVEARRYAVERIGIAREVVAAAFAAKGWINVDDLLPLHAIT